MRGDYKGAIDQCLSILKRMPEDLDAHTLIGDIYSESGDLVQAAQWYELALEVDSKSSVLRSKLEAVRERAQHKEIAETAEQLGLPTDGPRIMVYGSFVVIVVFVIGIAAYLLGQRHPVAKKSPLHISVDAPGTPDKPNAPAGADSGTPVDETANPDVKSANTLLPEEDRTLTLTLSQRDPLGSHIMSVSSDPRTKLLTINYTVRSDDDMKKIGAELARSSFDQVPDAITITVRAVRDDKLVYVADVSREKLNEAISNNQSQGGTSDAWIASALTYEWTPTSTPIAPAPASSPSSATTAPAGTSPATSTPPAGGSKDSGGNTAGNSSTGT